MVQDGFLLTFLRVYNADGKTGWDAETEHTINEGTHHLQMKEGDVELGEGIESFFVKGLSQVTNTIFKLGTLNKFLLVLFVIVGELAYIH